MSTSNPVAYFSMEYAIDQSLKIYSGGLGFLAGSHLRSAHGLRKDLVAIGILYSFGYHDQERDEANHMECRFVRKHYTFLEDTGIVFTISVHSSPVKVKVFLLPPTVFGTSPLYLLTTDIPENDYLSRTISHRLYDDNMATRVAQLMLLGIGGARLLEILGLEPSTYHLNEGHGLALIFHLMARYHNVEEVRKRVVFTTHTPEMAGNYEIGKQLLKEMGFFNDLPDEEIRALTQSSDNTLNFTLTALRVARIANAVSKIHEQTAKKMWSQYPGICPLISITNAQNKNYWIDPVMRDCQERGDRAGWRERKRVLKLALLEEVADQTGTRLDPDVLTIVWARRFASYKRADLLLEDMEKFRELVSRTDEPLQVIWAGKTYPDDITSIGFFNRLVDLSFELKRCVVLTGYELRLSGILKRGADVWLNTPRYTCEASGTSGMTAAMNGTINFSIPDGWVPEFAKHTVNAFVIPLSNAGTDAERDQEEGRNLMRVLEKEIIPTYYKDREKWQTIAMTSMKDIVPAFDSDRMVEEYFKLMYRRDTADS